MATTAFLCGLPHDSSPCASYHSLYATTLFHLRSSPLHAQQFLTAHRSGGDRAIDALVLKYTLLIPPPPLSCNDTPVFACTECKNYFCTIEAALTHWAIDPAHAVLRAALLNAEGTDGLLHALSEFIIASRGAVLRPAFAAAAPARSASQCTTRSCEADDTRVAKRPRLENRRTNEYNNIQLNIHAPQLSTPTHEDPQLRILITAPRLLCSAAQARFVITLSASTIHGLCHLLQEGYEREADPCVGRVNWRVLFAGGLRVEYHRRGSGEGRRLVLRDDQDVVRVRAEMEWGVGEWVEV